MLHHKFDISVADSQEMIDQILAFLTDGDWSDPWTEDPLYTSVGNPGELVLQSSGVSPVFVYVQTDGDGRLHFGVAATNPEWNTGDAPEVSNSTFASTATFCGLRDLEAGETATLSIVADNDRFVVLVEYQPADEHAMLFVGRYQPISAGVDDPDPIIAVGNTSLSGLETRTGDGRFCFPNVAVYTDPRGKMRTSGRTETSWFGGEVGSVPARETIIPANDRAAGSSVFSFTMYLLFAEPGRGAGASLSGSNGFNGILRTSDGLPFGETVTVGADTYLIAPLSRLPNAHDRACALIGPIGASIS